MLEQRIEQLGSQSDGIRAVRGSNARLLESFETEIGDLRRLQEQGFTGKQRLTELEREQASLMGENAKALSRISGNEIRIGEIRLQIIRLDRHRHTEIVNELETVQARLYDLGERLRALEDRLARGVIRAPVSGLVLGLAVDPVSLARMPHVRLLPGMPAEVLISTGTRTLLQYLLQPASNVIACSLIEDWTAMQLAEHR